MSFNRFDSMGELIEFVSLNDEIARGVDQSAHLFEFLPQNLDTTSDATTAPETTTAKESDAPGHVFWIIGTQSKDAKVDSFITSMALKSLQRGFMNPRDKVYFTTLVGLDWHQESSNPAKEAKVLRVLERWMDKLQPRCVLSFSKGTSSLRCHKLSDPMHEKLVEISEKPLLATEISIDTSSSTSVYNRFIDLCVNKDLSILEFGLDSQQRSFEECAQSEWKLSTGPALRWMIESLPFKITAAPELPVLEIIPPLEIPAEFNL